MHPGVESINADAITLPVELDRVGVTELRPRLERLRSGSSLTLDGSQIRRVHTPGVQLLCALVLAAEGRGVDVAWISVPPMLVTYVRLLGIGDVLRFCDQVPASLDRFE
jgi:ABC-type transporter Mla MlaB component